MARTSKYNKMKIMVLHKKFLKNRSSGKLTTLEFCEKHKISAPHLTHLFKSYGLKFPLLNQKHTAESTRKTALELEEFMKNPKNRVTQFFENDGQLSLFYTNVKKFGIPLKHRGAKPRQKLVDLTGSMLPNKQPSMSMTYTPRSPVEAPKKKGLLARLGIIK